MIYLIGGPPKCGKTTLAQHFSSKTQIPWVSTDTLECIIRPYLNTEDLKNKFPVKAQRMETNDEKYSNFSSEEIISAYREQSKTAYDAIDMFALCEITDGHDFIIEGYHITPELVDKLTKKHPENIRGVFVIKTEMDKFVENIKKSSTPNDWIIRRTKNEETYWKIAKTICEYGYWFSQEAQKYGFEVVNMDDDFEGGLVFAVKQLLNK